MKWKNAGEIASCVQSVVTILAILIGGGWFLFQGEAEPKANISHIVTHRQLNQEWVWVHVSITLANPGKRPIKIQSGKIWIQKILPLPKTIEEKIKKRISPIAKDKTVVDWPMVGKSYEIPVQFEIAPMEHGNLNYEFMVPANIRTVKIYSYFEKEKDPPMGWAHTTIYDLQKLGGTTNEKND